MIEEGNIIQVLKVNGELLHSNVTPELGESILDQMIYHRS